MRVFKGTFLLPIVIIVTASIIAAGLIMRKPEAKIADIEHKPLLINTAQVVKQELQISIRAQGTVTPRTTTTLVAEVSGSVIDVSPRFKSGGFFKKGEVLLQIDKRDYLTQLKRAEAAVASANSELATERGRAEVAYQDWIKYKSNVKRTKAATDLALRKPQQADAKAKLDAAIADLNHARNQLDRTAIKAPYDGLVRSKHVDIGQYVTVGSALAETFAIDIAEVRLALPQNKLEYLHLPDIIGDDTPAKPTVNLYAHIGKQTYQWRAQLVRTEGVFDERSRVLFAVAQISDPYGMESDQPAALRMGTFVDAEIQGKRIVNLVKLPRHILRTGNRVWVIDDEQRLQNREIKVLSTQGEHMYVTAGLEEGELVSLSNITGTIAGTLVRVVSSIATNAEPAGTSSPVATEPDTTIELAPADDETQGDSRMIGKRAEDRAA